MNKDSEKAEYSVRYSKVMEDLAEIKQLQLKERYMHRLMETVIFQDFETALDVMIEDFHVANDNQEEGLSK